MYKPGTNENDVSMSDVLCDFCHREWTDDLPVIEGHRGAVICGHCLAVAWSEMAAGGATTDPLASMCTMCREQGEDRAALDRADEPGWHSPAYPESAICTRCITRAADTLERAPDWSWTRGQNS